MPLWRNDVPVLLYLCLFPHKQIAKCHTHHLVKFTTNIDRLSPWKLLIGRHWPSDSRSIRAEHCALTYFGNMHGMSYEPFLEWSGAGIKPKDGKWQSSWNVKKKDVANFVFIHRYPNTYSSHQCVRHQMPSHCHLARQICPVLDSIWRKDKYMKSLKMLK